jgi:transposase InsO family protein
MALDSLGYRYGHTTVWQMVALYTEAHPKPTPPPHTPRAEERPLPTTAPHQVWFIDVRYLVKIEGHWLICPHIYSTDLNALRLLAEWHKVKLQHASYQWVACLSV